MSKRPRYRAAGQDEGRSSMLERWRAAATRPFEGLGPVFEPVRKKRGRWVRMAAIASFDGMSRVGISSAVGNVMLAPLGLAPWWWALVFAASTVSSVTCNYLAGRITVDEATKLEGDVSMDSVKAIAKKRTAQSDVDDDRVRQLTDELPNKVRNGAMNTFRHLFVNSSMWLTAALAPFFVFGFSLPVLALMGAAFVPSVAGAVVAAKRLSRQIDHEQRAAQARNRAISSMAWLPLSALEMLRQLDGVERRLDRAQEAWDHQRNVARQQGRFAVASDTWQGILSLGLLLLVPTIAALTVVGLPVAVPLAVAAGGTAMQLHGRSRELPSLFHYASVVLVAARTLADGRKIPPMVLERAADLERASEQERGELDAGVYRPEDQPWPFGDDEHCEMRMEGVVHQKGNWEFRIPSLELPVTGLTVIEGPSGSGKTTFLRLLAGLDLPEKGDVLINGRPTSELSMSNQVGLMTFVPAEAKLMGRTLREVLTVGNPRATDAEMVAMLHKVQLGGLLYRVSKQGDGEVDALDAPLAVSDGQKFRLVLASALLRRSTSDPGQPRRRPYALLLDEATRTLDPDSRDVVVNVLRELSREMSVVVASHDEVDANYKIVVHIDQQEQKRQVTYGMRVNHRGVVRYPARAVTGVYSNGGSTPNLKVEHLSRERPKADGMSRYDLEPPTYKAWYGALRQVLDGGPVSPLKRLPEDRWRAGGELAQRQISEGVLRALAPQSKEEVEHHRRATLEVARHKVLPRNIPLPRATEDLYQRVVEVLKHRGAEVVPDRRRFVTFLSHVVYDAEEQVAEDGPVGGKREASLVPTSLSSDDLDDLLGRRATIERILA